VASPPVRHHLNREAIRTLGFIILTALFGIIALSLWGISLRYGLFGATEPETGGVADEALSILGNIASAAVGGLVGWLTRDYVENKVGTQEMPPPVSPSDYPLPARESEGVAARSPGKHAKPGDTTKNAKKRTSRKEKPVADEPVVNDHPDDPTINPPEPVEAEDGSVEYPPDPNYDPVSIEEQDLSPVEVDDDYSPGEGDD
jgi:hypothetical protein